MSIVVNGQTIETDEEGSLADLKAWNEDVAKALARVENCELTPDHWEVIQFLRAYYDEYRISPAARVLAKAIGKKARDYFELTTPGAADAPRVNFN